MKKVKKITAVLTVLIMLAAPLCIINASAAGQWVTAWTTSMVNSSVSVAGLSLNDIIPSRHTVRTELYVTTGGTKLRFCFSNQYGNAPYTITEAFVAKTKGSGSASIVDGTSVRITFNEEQSVTVRAGDKIWSDAVDFTTETLDKISVSLYFADMVYTKTAGLSNGHTFLNTTNPISGASQCTASRLTLPNEIKITSSTVTYYSVPFLCEVETLSRSDSPACAVFIGDSTLVNDTYLYYAQRLAASGVKDVAVVNQAIVGNRLLSNCTGSLIGSLFGDSLKSRFRRDVLDLTNVRYVFVKIGLNDIIHQYSSSLGPNTPAYTPDDIIAGYKDLIALCHNRGIKIYFFTKSPWNGYSRAFLGSTDDLVWSEEAQAKCDELNKWITTNYVSDGFIDCSELADPSKPTALCPSFTPDGAHLTPLGSVALADLIPLNFAGGPADGKTAAAINKVDPYAEKKQIAYEMEHPTEATTLPPETTAPAEEPATAEGESATAKPEEPATVNPAEAVTAAQAESYTIIINVPTTAAETTAYYPQYILPSTTSVARLSPRQDEPATAPQINVEKIGSGTGIGFILILFLVIIVVGAVVMVNVTKKKEPEFDE